MYFVPQTICRTTDKTLWLYVGPECRTEDGIILFDEHGTKTVVPFKEWHEQYKAVCDPFGEPIVGKHDLPGVGFFDTINIKKVTKSKLRPDLTLKKHVLLTEKQKESFRRQALSEAVTRLKRNMLVIRRETIAGRYNPDDILSRRIEILHRKCPVCKTDSVVPIELQGLVHNKRCWGRGKNAAGQLTEASGGGKKTRRAFDGTKLTWYCSFEVPSHLRHGLVHYQEYRLRPLLDCFINSCKVAFEIAGHQFVVVRDSVFMVQRSPSNSSYDIWFKYVSPDNAEAASKLGACLSLDKALNRKK